MPPPGGWQPLPSYGDGPGWQQGPWLHPPGPPPPTGNGMKWLLGAVAVLLVIGITVGITVIVMSRGGDSGPSASPTGAASDIASANDTGPVSVITDEPTCSSYMPINTRAICPSITASPVARPMAGVLNEAHSPRRCGLPTSGTGAVSCQRHTQRSHPSGAAYETDPTSRGARTLRIVRGLWASLRRQC